VRTLRLLLWPAGAALGIAAEWVYFGWDEPADWVPDLLTGWTLIACGLIAWSRRPESRSGALMAATGFAWFAANFTSQALYLHRGPLIHLVLAYPDGRLRGRLDRVTVASAYAISVFPEVWRSEAATVVLAALLVLVAARGHLRALGRERRKRLAALQATGFVGAVLAGTAVARLAYSTQGVTDGTLLAYEAALCALAAALLTGLMREPWARTGVTDLVVELGEARSGTLRDALARALGDPTLEVGYWLPASGSYVNAAGRPLDMSPGPGRRVTPIELDGQPVAALVHDSAVLEDRALLDALSSAARLAASNARLQAEVRAQVGELTASRRRLVRAGDEERRRLEQRLHDSAERRLSGLARELEQSGARASDESEAGMRVRRAEEHLALTLGELRELAAGLHPRVLSQRGLAGALAALAEQSPVPVEVEAPDVPLPTEIEAAAYFVCSEALANVAKYASASRAAVSVRAEDGRVIVAVVDDGRGGAEIGRGSGLRGLADRVETLGGTLTLDSPAGGGTHLEAELPSGNVTHGRPHPAPG
jgi:signal transduction histidine kinase